jgi:hypothetical protein
MNIETNTVRFLGAAQLLVIVGGVIMERLSASVVGSGSISEMLVNISNNYSRMRISNLVGLIQSFVIVVLGVLYYSVLNQEYKIIALLALGCFLVAAITLAVGKIGAHALIPLSQKFVAAEAPASSHFQTLGDVLYYGVDRRGYDIHMLFTCLGLILVNYLFYVSGYIPRALSVWGLVAIFLLTIPTVLQLYDRDFLPAAQLLAIPYAPY